jgi:hypothetical protein
MCFLIKVSMQSHLHKYSNAAAAIEAIDEAQLP